MRRIVGPLLGLLLVAGCAAPGARTQADQDRDTQVVVTALHQVDQGGAHFTMENQLAYTGGAVPSGQELLFQ